MMNKNVLVVFDTKSGSTAEVAQYIADTLAEAGSQVAVEPVELVETIERYDAVFIGSPIINGKCMPGVKKFVSFQSSALSEIPLAYFITCMRLSQVAGVSPPDIPLFIDPAFGDPKPKKEMTFPERSHPVTMYLKAITGMAKELRPVSISFFRGVLDYRTVGFIMTLLFKFMARVDGLGPGDYRNWEAIRSWTVQTYLSL
jgi:menaquinone-dependent protoporphyrinogen oxidase